MRGLGTPATSARDPRVGLAARLLRDRDERRRRRAVILDGLALVQAALDEQRPIEWVLAGDPGAAAIRRLPADVPVAPASADALRALAALGQPPDVVALCRLPEPPPPDLPGRSIVLAGVHDEGNVGSIVRTAAALGVPRVWVADCADPWSRKGLRASRGTALRDRLVGEVADVDAVARLSGRPPLAAALPRGGAAPDELPDGTVIVLGGEGSGLSAGQVEACELAVTVPAARFESLNVAAAAAILMWELARRPPG